MTIGTIIRDNVFVRTVEYLNNKDAALVSAFLSCKDQNVPVVYQHCQPKLPNDNTNSEVIGHATDFRIDNGNMMCTVTLYPASIRSVNFTDCIDNYTVNISQKKNELVFTVTRLIVYNKDFKSVRDNEYLDYLKCKAETNDDTPEEEVCDHES